MTSPAAPETQPIVSKWAVATFLLGLVSLVPLSVIAANVLAAYTTSNPGEGTNLRIALALWCAAVPPLILLAASSGAAAPAVWSGWLLGGVLFTVDNAVLLPRNRSDYSMVGPWWQLYLVVGLGVALGAATWLTRTDRGGIPASRS